MIAAILLAAGRSQRMGTQKLLLPFSGTTVIAHIVDQITSARVDHVVVVVSAKEISDALKGKNVKFATNDLKNADMLSSVRVGLQAIPVKCKGMLVALGDHPRISWKMIDRMVDEFQMNPHSIIVPTFGGRRGHPLLFSAAYVEAINTQFDGDGLHGLLRAYPQAVREFSVDTDAVLGDMDEWDDYQRELQRHETR